MNVRPRLLSYVVPAFDEEETLPLLVERIRRQRNLAERLEIIVVDDHSDDRTFDVLERLAQDDPALRAVRLARNCGSHMALLAGISLARGEVVIALAADGQDPPELTERLLSAWKEGAQVVWAVRQGRQGVSRASRVLSRSYYGLMNRWSAVRLPPDGADFVLLDRRVVDALIEIPERHVSLFALITWLGFRQVEIPYVKEARLSGRSKWTLLKKLELIVDSLVGFSRLPLRLASGLGVTFALLGFLYATSLVANKLTGGLLFGQGVRGWSALMVVLLVSSGVVMLILGVIGEYLWRVLEEVRGRPRFHSEAEINLELPVSSDLPPRAGEGDAGD